MYNRVFLLVSTIPYEQKNSEVYFSLDKLINKLKEEGFTYYNDSDYFCGSDNSDDRVDERYNIYICRPDKESELVKTNLISEYNYKKGKERIKNNIREIILTKYSVADIISIKYDFNYGILESVNIELASNSKLLEVDIIKYISDKIASQVMNIEINVKRQESLS